MYAARRLLDQQHRHSRQQRQLMLGKVAAAHGVKGWLKIISYTRPAENILGYSPWTLSTDTQAVSIDVLEGRTQGRTSSLAHANRVIVRLAGIRDRAAAGGLAGAAISIAHAQLPALPVGEYYWHDLLRLQVVNLAGECLGRVSEIRETGANDVLVVEGRRRCFIPWVYGYYIESVDLAAGTLWVNWRAGD